MRDDLHDHTHPGIESADFQDFVWIINSNPYVEDSYHTFEVFIQILCWWIYFWINSRKSTSFDDGIKSWIFRCSRLRCSRCLFGSKMFHKEIILWDSISARLKSLFENGVTSSPHLPPPAPFVFPKRQKRVFLELNWQHTKSDLKMLHRPRAT